MYVRVLYHSWNPVPATYHKHDKNYCIFSTYESTTYSAKSIAFVDYGDDEVELGGYQMVMPSLT